MTTARWSAVVPFKGRGASKSRLGGAEEERAALAEAFLLDTLAACAACVEIGTITLVTSDEHAVAAARSSLGEVGVLPDPGGLDAAVRAGAAAAARERPEDGVVIVLGDMPALRPDDLGAALRAAERPRAVVADRDGTGTTALVLAPGAAVEPAFGAGSLARHRASGHVPVVLAPDSTLRLDVDTAADLSAAALAGLGPRTAALLGRQEP